MELERFLDLSIVLLTTVKTMKVESPIFVTVSIKTCEDLHGLKTK